ncbi:DUF7537 family lipoprotein [Halospeciosus flavus]|uniref:Lipoprotein n=1 Tax=Halospeciosus flavus TaxID=3032283 RepID=A0ABD5Z909_9EURY|nr:hypothetical protein [Halospeciosus flavus]
MRSRTRTLTALLLVAALVVGAGCAAMPGGETKPYETPLNGSEMEQKHATVLQEAGSYTYELNYSSSFSGQSFLGTNVSAQVDTESDAAFFATNSSLGPIEVYVPPNGSAYQRIGTGEEARYRQIQQRPNLSQFARLDLTNLTAKTNFTANGTTTIDGETVWVYESSANESLSMADSVFEHANSSVTLYVRSDGLVKRTTVTVTAGSGDTSGSLTLTRTFRKVGSTMVEEPAWLDEAKNATA